MNKKDKLLRIEERLKAKGIKYFSDPVFKCQKLDRIIGPDFCVINKITGEQFLWLHFIDMNNQDYVETVFMPKFKEYNSLGFIMGVNMIVTCETEEEPIEVSEIDETIRRYLLTESKEERSVLSLGQA
ncbi:MAG: hypothetical protein K6F82_04150 [Sphaerochaetaceae bacterium]|nr:hypothetical protein [Sphaerochaetaceae bacterium]